MFENWLNNQDPDFIKFLYRIYLSEKRQSITIRDDEILFVAKKLNMRINDIEQVMNYRL